MIFLFKYIFNYNNTLFFKLYSSRKFCWEPFFPWNTDTRIFYFSLILACAKDFHPLESLYQRLQCLDKEIPVSTPARATMDNHSVQLETQSELAILIHSIIREAINANWSPSERNKKLIEAERVLSSMEEGITVLETNTMYQKENKDFGKGWTFWNFQLKLQFQSIWIRSWC